MINSCHFHMERFLTGAYKQIHSDWESNWPYFLYKNTFLLFIFTERMKPNLLLLPFMTMAITFLPTYVGLTNQSYIILLLSSLPCFYLHGTRFHSLTGLFKLFKLEITSNSRNAEHQPGQRWLIYLVSASRRWSSFLRRNSRPNAKSFKPLADWLVNDLETGCSLHSYVNAPRGHFKYANKCTAAFPTLAFRGRRYTGKCPVKWVSFGALCVV